MMCICIIFQENFNHLPYVIENEFDWPSMSATTGFYILLLLLLSQFKFKIPCSMQNPLGSILNCLIVNQAQRRIMIYEVAAMIYSSCSSSGFVNITWPISPGPVESIYLLLRERNRCLHRDYQNIAVNGADSFTTQEYQTRWESNLRHVYLYLESSKYLFNDNS